MPPVDNPPSEPEDSSRDPAEPPFSSSANSSAFAGACKDDGKSIQDAWRHLRAGAQTDAQLSENSLSERARQQAGLIDLANRTEWTVLETALLALPVLSDRTAEHKVYLASDRCVLKATLPGWCGQVPIILDGRLQRREANPAQYLDRICLHNVVFNGRIKLVGFCVSGRPSLIIGEPPGQPSIVTSQPFYLAADLDHPAPTPEKLDKWMRAQGFLGMPASHFGWVRPADGVVVTDAKPDNFIFTADGILPIDLQIAQVDPGLLRQLVVS